MKSAPRDYTEALFFQKGNPGAVLSGARYDTIRIDEWRDGRGGRFHREYPEAPYVKWQPLPNHPTDT